MNKEVPQSVGDKIKQAMEDAAKKVQEMEREGDKALENDREYQKLKAELKKIEKELETAKYMNAFLGAKREGSDKIKKEVEESKDNDKE